LFKGIVDENIGIDLVKRIIIAFWELIEILCAIKGIDFLELQKMFSGATNL
jgi:hypothetical protein